MTVDQRGNRRLVTPEDEAELAEIDESAEVADRAFQRFRELQTVHEMDAREFRKAKEDVRGRLRELSDTLDRYCAAECGVDSNNPKAFDKWLSSHQPFHWLAEFYGVICNRGFDVVFGNPPYVEYSKVRKQYQ
jgi:aminoglycoside phosphotransferase (APT) family kinase protein